MAQRRYGPTLGAGTVVIEADAEKQIDKGQLGTTVYVGILERGIVGKLFRAGTKKEFLRKAGSYIEESYVPDNAFDFYSNSRGAGELYLLRVTDGSEVASSLILKGRKNEALEAELSHNSSGQYVYMSDAAYLSIGAPSVGRQVNVYNDSGETGIRYITAVDADLPSAGYKRLTLSGSAVDAFLAGDSLIIFNNEANPEIMKIEAANGGRWAGKKSVIFDTSFGVGGLAATSFDTGKTMLKDFYKGAKISFAAMPGKSYEIISNTTAGVITVTADRDMANDYLLSGSSDETWTINLLNENKALAILIKDGLQNPTTEFGLEVYDSGVMVLDYQDLSLDSSSKYYYEGLINDDENNDYIQVTNLWTGAVADEVRPSNEYGQVIALSDTTMQGDVTDITKSNGGGAMTGDGELDTITFGGNAQKDTIEVECLSAGAKAQGTITIGDNAFDVAAAVITGADVTGTYPLGDFSTCAHNKFDINLYGQGLVEVALNLAACTTGANTATEMQTKINAAIATAGYVGTVTVAYSTDHFVITSEAKGMGIEVAVADTGETGGGFATEAKITAALRSNYTAGSGDYVRFTFDNGTTNYDFAAVEGTAPAATGRFIKGGTTDASATALGNAITAHAIVNSYISNSVLASVVTIQARLPKDVSSLYSVTESDGATDNFTIVNFAGGADQTWSYTSSTLGLISGATPKTGEAFTAPNDFGIGFTIQQGSVDFIVGDKFTVAISPWEPNSMVGGYLYPDAKGNRRQSYKIIANTYDTITVKSGSDMTSWSRIGKTYRVEFLAELAGGYNGLADIQDNDYINALDPATSEINNLFGLKKGLVKVACPGINSSAIQKAGAAYAEARNYQFRYEVPANITTETGAESYINDTIGRNDFAVVSFPSYMYVSHPTASGLKLVPNTGAIHGREALVAKNYDGYHKAAAGIDVTIPQCIKLPTGDKSLDEELLNKHGIGLVKFKNGICIIWGDRTLSVDPAWKWKHQREQMSHYENDLRESFDWIIFAINDELEQKKADSALRSYFRPEWKKRALRGADFGDSARIKVDNEINTDLTRANGDMYAEVALRLADTVERFIITMSKMGIFESAE